MSDLVLYEKNGPIGKIIFNDPDRLNALSEEMADKFQDVIDQVQDDPELRCVILTGAGRAFSAGGNLDMIAERRASSKKDNKRIMTRFYLSYLSLLDIKVPTVALINGHAIGAAFCVALGCDFRIASEKAKMGVNFVKLGLSPGMGGSWILSRVAGLPVATDLLLTGRTIDAQEALRLGLVNQVHSSETIEQVVNELTETLCSNGPLAVEYAKYLLYRNAARPLDKALADEAFCQANCFESDDLAEGVEAIRAKRKPVFQGK